MVDKLENLDNLIIKLNTILTKDKRFENEINYNHYLKKMNKESESKNVEVPLIMSIPDYSVNLTVKKESKEKCSCLENIENMKKLEKDLEDLINNLSSTSSLDLSLLLSELEKLKKKSRENLRNIKTL